MSDVQKLRCFTPVKNEVLQALISSNLSGTEIKIALLIYRKTIGWNKKSDKISLSQFTKYIPVSRRFICKALKNILLVNVCSLVKKGSPVKMASEYAFNENVKTWRLVKKSSLVNKRARTSEQKSNSLVNKSSPTKETLTKETIQKKPPYSPPAGGTVEGLNYSKNFLSFWSCYPKKIGKGAAWSAWKKAKSKPEISALIEILKKHEKSQQWQKNNGQFIPNPATWLNHRRWEDEVNENIITNPFS